MTEVLQQPVQPGFSLGQENITPYSKAAADITVNELPKSRPQSGSFQDESEAIQAIQPDVEDTDLLISSPYTEPHHRLRLSVLDIQSQLLARALTTLDATSPQYASLPYTDALDWPALVDELRRLTVEAGHTWHRQTFYVVAFFSKLQVNADRDLLHQLDKESHAEAAESGGLLKYWFGSPDSERRNLATCVWRGEDDARAGGKGPWHKRARAEARNLYESIEFKRMDFVLEDGLEGWSIE